MLSGIGSAGSKQLPQWTTKGAKKTTVRSMIRQETMPLLHVRRPMIAPHELSKDFNPEIVEKNKGDFLNLNVSGKKFRVLKTTLLKYHVCPKENDNNNEFTENEPLLEILACDVCFSNSEKRCLPNCYLDELGELFFDRSEALFEHIIDFYRTEKLHCPMDICPEKFLAELSFWKIDPQLVAPCCSDRLGISHACKVTILDETNSPVKGMSNGLIQRRSVGDADFLSEEEEEIDIFEGIFLSKPRKRLWEFMENPQSSRFALAFTFFSAGFIFLSIIGLVMSSMKDFQDLEGKPKPFLDILEAICVAWFTFDYLARLLVTPERLKFIKSPLNVVDLLSIIPFYVEGILDIAGVTSETLENLTGPLLMMRILRVLRVARIFKIARYSGGLKTFATSMKASRREIGMLFMFIGTNVLVCSTIVYYFEKDVENSKFESIPHTFWWCIVTMTTVGYGDITPKTLGGRLIASLTSVSGVIVLAFPITIIVENFNKHYKKGTRDSDSVASGPVRRGFRGIPV